MNTKTILLPLISGLVLALPVEAKAESMPANFKDLWAIIQKQQKEIETLKAKAQETEHLKQEVEQLRASGTAAGPDAKPGQSAQSPVGKTPAANSSASSANSRGKTPVEQKTDILAAEVEKLKTNLVIPEKREYKTEYGFGPAASEVYRVNRGLSIGGYGEWFYSNYSGSGSKNVKDTFDMARAVIYVGYKFNDWIVLNNEIEFEHGSTGEGDEKKGEVSVEFSQLDFFLHKAANVRAGLMLVPMGFINEIHEPTTFHGNRRPSVERYIIPTTWREMGVGLFGEIVPGLQYRVYAMNSLNAKGYTSAGIRDGRQSGTFALSEDFAFTGRLDYTPSFLPGALFGFSTFLGDAGQDENFMGQKVNAFTQLYEGHIQWRYKGLEFRTLGAYGQIGNAGQLSAALDQTVGSSNYGVYTELAYDIMPWLFKNSSQYLAPFFRYENYNTLASVPDGFSDYGGFYERWVYQAGLTYKPIPNISIKADYRNVNTPTGGVPSEVNLGIGFIY